MNQMKSTPFRVTSLLRSVEIVDQKVLKGRIWLTFEPDQLLHHLSDYYCNILISDFPDGF